VAIGSCAGSLYALSRDSGQPLWLYDTAADGPGAQFHGEPLLLNNAIIVPTDAEPTGYLYSFDARSGDLRWKVPFKDGIACTPLLVDGQLAVVSADGEVAAIDPSTGKVSWKVAPAGTVHSSPRIPSPASADGKIFFGDNSGKLFALDAVSGKTIWRKDLSARLNTSLAVVGKTLVGGTGDGFMVRIAVDSGEITERLGLSGLPYGTLISSPPLLLILVKGEQSKLVAFDTTTGKIRWEQSTPREWTTYRPLVSRSTVIVGSEEKNLCAFSLSDGTLRWCREIGQVPRGLGISSDGILYVGTLSGKVLAYQANLTDPAAH
jgi:eukaryotic-like serine/threonine-protein kinase